MFIDDTDDVVNKNICISEYITHKNYKNNNKYVYNNNAYRIHQTHKMYRTHNINRQRTRSIQPQPANRPAERRKDRYSR